MITGGFSYVAVIVFFAGLVIFTEKNTKLKFFEYVPAIVVIYFGVMLMSSVGLWERSGEIKEYYKSIKHAILPAMIFLMLLKADLRQIAQLGPKMLIAFFAASITIGTGFVVTYGLFQSMYAPDAWKAFAALAGSWMGGTANMVAIQGALEISDSDMGYTLLIDSIDYAIWVMILLSLVPYSKIFDKFTKADSATLDKVAANLEKENAKHRQNIEFSDMMMLTGTSLLVSAVAWFFADILPHTSFLSGTTWAVIIASTAGIILGMTKFGKLPGSNQVANVMLYSLVGLIASGAKFSELTEAPLYIFSGFVILAVHVVLMIIIAKIFKLDLFSCGIASLANIGGVASAPILAAAYGEALIPIGVLMAMLGYIVGTGGGLLVGSILSML
jgi:uncharacterized membrane protein